MKFKKSKLVKGITVLALMVALGGCASKEAELTKTPEKETPNVEDAGIATTELDWSIQPKLGITKGDYFRIEERFRQGHLGVLEVVKNEDEIVLVEFNELTRPNYYHRYFQNIPKRMSEYNFTMGEKKGAAWIQSVLMVEKQMLEKQELTGDFDVVSGASNSINQSMLPLAEELLKSIDTPTGDKFYSIAEELEGGLTGLLKVIVNNGKITSVHYDEIFADSPEQIKADNLKKFYRQSKYESVEYEEPSRIGFNVQIDALNEAVVASQDMFDLSTLPAIGESGDYASSGFTTRNTAWDNYLNLAEKLMEEIKADGNL